MNTKTLTLSHYGVVRFGDLECEADQGGRFARFLANLAPNSLSQLENTHEPILLPSDRQAQFFPAGIIVEEVA
ncbi:hypothetical protein [Nitrosomonas communis]|uniref:Uncharacterized protein n=1 Tax=Nitrosomonas communis TaxID=44574 RepID=A0A1I4LNC1_9PROT|nr:hypothetical protein [Nitrosomonas communis]SFL92460.1 hypothetical protein SAMN05421863_100723 [Nitrosomonas communis]